MAKEIFHKALNGLPDLLMADKFAMVILAEDANLAGAVHFRNSRLARKMNTSPEDVEAILDRLNSLGYIKVDADNPSKRHLHIPEKVVVAE